MSSYFRRRSRRDTFERPAAAWQGLQPLEQRSYMSGGPFDVGASLGTASPLGAVATVLEHNGGVGALDDINLFAINVVAGQQMSFDIDSDSGLDSVLRVFDSTGRQIARNDNRKAPGEAKSLDAFATVKFKTSGQYYIGVSSAGNVKYNVATGEGAAAGKSTGAYTLDITNLTPEDTAGKTLPTARELAELSGQTDVHEFVGKADKLDYYRFVLSDDSEFALTLTGMTGAADVRIAVDRNGDGKIAKKEVVGISKNAGNTEEVLVGELEAGEYFVEIRGGKGDTYYDLGLFAEALAPEPEPASPEPDPDPTPEPTPEPTPDPTPEPTPVDDWFSQNLRDAGIISLSRSLFVDGSVSRGDMMQILRIAGDDDGVVDAVELQDLRIIVTVQGAEDLGVSEQVRILATKVVNNHTANANFQGAALGNLAAGSGEVQLDKLVDKWFLGADRPQTYYQYRLAAGSLFINGAALSDLRQGYVGDCYLLASLGSVAMIEPSAITDMFTNNGDGTYTVRYYRSGVADYVTVDSYLPTDSYGRLVYAGMGASVSSASTELWVALAEKAYAQINEAGWIGQNGANAYSGIEGGWMEPVYEQILGSNASSTYYPSQAALVNAFLTGKMVTLGSNSSTNSGVIGGHAYVLQNYHADTGTFDLFNPWGSQHATGLTFAQVSANFAWIATA